MYFRKTIQRNAIVFEFEHDEITDYIVETILSERYSGRKIGLDMKNIKSINSTLFVECLLENKFMLFNLSNSVLTYLSFVLRDGFLKSYMNFEDFCKNKRELIKRHFLVV